MNYFGLFFTFMLPGIIIGITAMATVMELGRIKRRRAHKAVSATRTTAPVATKALPVQRSLYVHNLEADSAA